MSFSPEWDDAYRSGTHLSRWPWSDLVSFVYRYAKPTDGFNRVLELGCGVGANIPFFLDLGVIYYAVEGSPNAVARILAAYPDLQERVVNTDFAELIPFSGPFDLVVDRSALIHNPTEAMRGTLRMISDRLRPGGKFIGIDWFSSDHQDFAGGELVDLSTRTNFKAGEFSGIGNVHFCNEEHLSNLIAEAGLLLEYLEHKRTEVLVSASCDRFGYWNFVAIKP
jgi:SAM-dependent methyltransferase